MTAAADPHLRYEKEAMYPPRTGIFGDAYVGKPLADHDSAIRNARELAWLAENDALTEQQAGRGVKLTRQILPHVIDCDGLAIIGESLPDDAVGRVLLVGKAAQEANLDLLAWAATAREPRA